jgi:tetratricopeptide (TPR) repeat protein
VATRFRYISMSFGIGRYQPHAALDVLKNEYGDCKDKHTLLASLLAAVGIEAYPALMNSSRHIDPDVPSPGQFDHVITAVPESPNSGKLIWLDTTTEVAPFGLLAFQLRDKQALVIPGALPPLLVTTPAEPPFKSFQRFEMDAKLSDTGVLEGTMHRTFRGDTELLERIAFRQTPQSQWKDLVQAISQAAGFMGEVSEVEVASPEATSEPFHFSNKYTRKDYPDWANHRITAPLGFIGFPEIKENEKRTRPILLGAPEEFTSIAKVELPKGYVPKLLADVNLVRDFAEYHSTYAFKDGVFVAEDHILVKKGEVPLSALDDYRSFQKAESDSQNLYTELSNGSAPVSPQPYVFTPSPSGDATGLLMQAQAALQRRDLDDAVDLLERALKLDDHYKDAWVMLGTLLFAKGQRKEGIADLRKAIELDPKDPHSYRVLAYAYMHASQPEEAIPVWQDLLKQDPKDINALITLGEILRSLKRYDEAIPLLESARAILPSSSPLDIALANAYLGAGKPDKAAPLLKEAADISLSPMVWNEAAYALADNNLNLPVAQLYAEKAVQSLEHDTANVELDHLEKADLDRMTQLGNDWDTLGWAYFREGDIAKAQKYLEAAWNLYQDRVIGEHVAQVYEKQGKAAAAKHQYILARGLPDLSAPLPSPDDRFAPPTAARMSAVEELSEMRRTELGKVSTKQGSAEFFVLLAPGGTVEDVKFISGDENIRPLSKKLASLKFKAPLPDDAPVKLVRRGVLMCNGLNLNCDFTLLPVEAVHSTQ